MSGGSNRGVSLLEMLVALAVFGVVATVLYGSFSRTLLSRELAEQRGELFASARLAMDWLEQDLKSSLTIGTYPLGNMRFISSGHAGEDSLESDLPLLDMSVRAVRRTALLGAGNEQASGAAIIDQARVVYRVERSGDAGALTAADASAIEPGLGLVRYELRPALEGELEAAQRTVLIRNVVAVDFTFSDGGTAIDNRWDHGDSATPKGRGPRLVDITLTLRTRAGGLAQFTTSVLIPLGARRG